MEQQIRLIDELIAENPDATIKDFQECLNDIERVELAAEHGPALQVKVQDRDIKGRFTQGYWLSSYGRM